jgi:GT2 family glycosyltransferase
MDVSIVFVNYKTEALLLDCLRSIYSFTSSIAIECIVVDNQFIPQNNRAILTEFPQTQWIDSGYNSGFSIANNIGMHAARGKYVLFLNADTLIFDNSICQAWKHLEEDASLVAIGGNQLDLNKQALPYYLTLNDIRKDLYIVPNHPFFQKLINKLLPVEPFSRQEETNNLVGAFLMASKETLHKLNGWDEDFFMYAEDAELSFRLSKIGKLAYFSDVNFIHLINENEFRRTEYSWVNRFSMQIQVSNLLWIRKSYGIIAYLLLYLNYNFLAPIFWAWKVSLNVYKGKSWDFDTKNQRIFGRKVVILNRYFLKILFLCKGPYRIKPDENIDQVMKS